MRRIRKFIGIVFLVCLGFTGLVCLSLLGENDYLENCKNLNIECEPGNVQKMTKKLFDYYEKGKVSLFEQNETPLDKAEDIQNISSEIN